MRIRREEGDGMRSEWDVERREAGLHAITGCGRVGCACKLRPLFNVFWEWDTGLASTYSMLQSLSYRARRRRAYPRPAPALCR